MSLETSPLPPGSPSWEFPWQLGSWCLDTVKDASQWSREPDSLGTPSPLPCTPSSAPPFPPLQDADARWDFRGAGDQRQWEGGEGRRGNPSFPCFFACFFSAVTGQLSGTSCLLLAAGTSHPTTFLQGVLRGCRSPRCRVPFKTPRAHRNHVAPWVCL